MSEITRYPLCWPNNVGRTAPGNRRRAQFLCSSIASGVDLVMQEVNRLNRRVWNHRDESLIISTNLRLRKDQLPAADQGQPVDTGVAVYFRLRFTAGGREFERPIVMTCDRWLRVEWNLRAIAMDIEAQRARARWGCTDMMQAFQGYVAIPERCGGKAWWEVLGIRPVTNMAEINQAYKARAAVLHPDKPGGDEEGFKALQVAREQALAALAGGAEA